MMIQDDFFRPELMSLALRLVSQRSDADDLVQDTILSLIVQHKKVNIAYAKRRLVSRWINSIRAQERLPITTKYVGDLNSDGETDPETLRSSRETWTKIREALGDNYELLLKRYAGKSVIVLAEELGIQSQSLRNRLHRAVKRARSVL